MPRLVVFAYACEPDKGSEPGAGWIWSRMIARIGETWVITRANNRPSIEEHLPSIPERDNLHFVYVDLPKRARFWKRRNKGARLYYLMWQAAALKKVRSLHRDRPFDAAWHLTWANAWIGSIAATVPVPFVYGPVAGGVSVPWRLTPSLGVRGFLFEIGRTIARTVARYGNPIARLAWRRASLILVQNPETKDWLPRRHRGRAVVFPNVLLDRPPRAEGRSPRESPFTALFAGRLLAWKGLALALEVIRSLPGWRLVICGHGPDGRRLRRLTRRLGLEDRVEFQGLKTREEVYSWMQQSDVFLFPSLHDEGGFVVAEALSEGLPVVCLDWGGPPLLGGTPVEPTTIQRTISALADATVRAVGTKTESFPLMSEGTEDLRVLLDGSFPSWGLLRQRDGALEAPRHAP